MVSVSEEKVCDIDTHFRKYYISGIDTSGFISTHYYTEENFGIFVTCDHAVCGMSHLNAYE